MTLAISLLVGCAAVTIALLLTVALGVAIDDSYDPDDRSGP